MPTPSRVATAHGYICDHCSHGLKQVYTLSVEFVIEDTIGDQLGVTELIDQLKDGLPKEWFVGYNMADWGVKDIRPYPF